MSLQILIPFLVVMSSVSFIFAEKWFPYNEGQKLFRGGFWTDLMGYGLLQSYVLGVVIAFVCQQIEVLLHQVELPTLGSWPFWGQLLLFLVWHDLNTYLIHRLQHAVPFLWRTHEAHHSTQDVDWLSGIRSSAPEIMIYETAKFLPMILFGAAPEVFVIRAFVDATWGMFIHSNLNVKLGPLIFLFNGPELHRWHHSKDESAALGKNFSTKFSIWDFLFQTAYHPPFRRARNYGVEDKDYPSGYWLQQLASLGIKEKQVFKLKGV